MYLPYVPAKGVCPDKLNLELGGESLTLAVDLEARIRKWSKIDL